MEENQNYRAEDKINHSELKRCIVEHRSILALLEKCRDFLEECQKQRVGWLPKRCVEESEDEIKPDNPINIIENWTSPIIHGDYNRRCSSL